ncbi:MAG: hypothetical protein CL878_15770 [Dehalococcoidia bacterium]|nr:hypothetical protein [Dehalococcoidia bacterium]
MIDTPTDPAAFHVALDDAFQGERQRGLGWNLAANRYAVGLGTTDSPADQRWAELVVEAFLADSFSDQLLVPDGWLSTARTAWHRAIERGSAGGGIASDGVSPAASFIGLFTEPYDSPNGTVAGQLWRWWAVAAGECSLFHLRPDEVSGVPTLVGWLPVRASAHFGALHDDMATIMPRSEGLGPWVSLHMGTCLPGDLVVLATPALSRWILTEHEAHRDLWVYLVTLPGEEEAEFTQALRDLQAAGEVATEPTSLVVARIGEIPAIEQPALEIAEVDYATSGEVMPAGAIVARHQGRPFPKDRRIVFGGPIRCFRCGNDFPDGTSRCLVCGAPLTPFDRYRRWRNVRRFMRRVRRRLRRLFEWLF